MTQVVSCAVVEAGALDDILAARDGLIAERPLGHGRFDATDGPVEGYRRMVAVEQLPDGRSAVTQTVTYQLRIPFFGPLFQRGYRRWLGRIGALPKTVWWAPPARLGVPQWAVLTRLAGLAMVTGYLSTLLTQTMTFSAQEFGAGKAAQGVALAVVRVDVVLAIALVALADRRGRRAVVIWATVVGSGLTAIGALSPSLPWLVTSQVVARGFITGVTITAAVLAAEAMPAGSRAWCVGVLAMASAAGVGVCVVLLPIAGVATAAWRALYALGIIGVPLALLVGRRLPESRRFLAAEAAHHHPAAAGPAQAAAAQAAAAQGAAAQAAPATGRSTPPVPRRFRQRLALLAGGAFLFNIFSVPASQFQNEYLRKERYFSAPHISLFIVLTVLPGALGIMLGGRLADTHGRRTVGAVSLVLGVSGAVLFYLSRGWTMWAASTAAAVVGTAVIPALSVYGPELFPTAVRGLANGIITGAGRVGSVVGLVSVGLLASAFGRFGPAFALMAVGPLALAVLVVRAFPETAGRELEELNPEDRASARAPVPARGKRFPGLLGPSP